MHYSNTATVERIDQQPVMDRPVPAIQSAQPARQSHDIPSGSECVAYHFVTLAEQDGCSALYVVNEFGVPDDTLSDFARQLASSIGPKQAQAQLASLLSYLTYQEQRGLLWHAPASSLQEVWQDYLRRCAPCWEMNDGDVTVLAVTVEQSRDLHALRAMLARFYTFAIARSIYAYRHPFARQRRLVCLPLHPRLQRLLSPWLHPFPSHI